MRIMIKGGVWKNTEDEILKAAVMKYGKNQWARISSLLVRKSAKQCKARWYEWLDPSIKKTEWTREEDEKLLHLAKLMPTQWRTIAPIVGRTPSQCLERYEKLLDAACAKDENYEPGDDPRKLRPGEIDPNPESKPARPDPVDMDEDEKEMLSEARARLANTRGKKAKRKAREKQLEEARRLASLQKRRELKAAGIDTRQRKRKRKGIDYNSEIPFEKKPPPGFFDVADEDRPVEQVKFPTTIEELEGKRRIDMEAQLRRQDISKNKIAQRQDAPSAILQANKMNDPETVRKRSKLMLPAPLISDHELEEIAKMGYASDLAGNEELTEGSGATRALLANYAQTPQQGMTPVRTPQRTPAGKGDAIMMEAENLARLRESQTPLLGGDNPELHPSDFSGVTPKKRDIQTPNPMLTPSATPGGVGLTPRIGMTPSRDGSSFGMTPKGTPIRDELRINEDMEMHDSAKLEQQRQADLRRNLRSGLSTLPQPKNEYQIVIQPPPEENEEPEEKIEEDMSDRLAREKAEEEARQQALLRKRSKVLQRELPRPPVASLELIRNSLLRADGDKSSFVPPTSIEQADEIIRKELLNLLEHDNAKYPLDEKVEKKKKGNKRSANGSAAPIPVIEDFEEDELQEADSLIKEEAQYLRMAMGHENESLDEFVEAHNTCLNDLMYFPTRNAYGLSSVAGNMEKLAALQSDFEIVKKKMDDDKEKALHLEKKIKLLTQGYEKRAENLRNQIQSTVKQMETAGTELGCFQALHKQEQLASSNRINGLWEEVQKQKELERALQQRYGDLSVELERTRHLMEEYRVQAQKQEEIASEKHSLELAKAQAAANQATEQIPEASESLPSEEPVSSMPVEITDQQMDTAHMDVDSGKEHAGPNMDGSLSNTASESLPSEELVSSMPVEITDQQMDTAHMDVDSGKEHAGPDMDGSLSNTAPSSADGTLPGNSHDQLVDGIAGDMTGNAAEASNPDGAFTKQESIAQETAKDDGFDNGNAIQVSGAEGELEIKDNQPVSNGDHTDK
ncbi:cell division cycle 5-like protein [Melia azedarach]|uniref:Cell division cycle 5-like protein n=1 Tax=Melia azedarach TaxID=155640 RepID=A0ACC1Y9G8_MELAZ|nr:cell division cycle 5-like protein [Melia azedarach]